MQGENGFSKSMSGVVEITDGAGTTIEGGVVTTNQLITNDIQGQTAGSAITLYSNTTGSVNLGKRGTTLAFGGFSSSFSTMRATVNGVVVMLFDNQVANIVLGNTAITTTIGSFNLLLNKLEASTPSSFIQLFSTQTAGLQLGNFYYLIQIGGFNFLGSTIQLANNFTLLSFFTNQIGNIQIGNTGILINIGSFNFSNNQITATTPANALFLFPTTTGTIALGSDTSIFNQYGNAYLGCYGIPSVNGATDVQVSSGVGTSALHFHSGITWNNTYDSQIIATGGTGVQGSGNIAINASTINIGLTNSNTIIEGQKFPLTVICPTDNGIKSIPKIVALSNTSQRGNLALYASFSGFPADQTPRRVCDIYGGFVGTWGGEYMAFGVGLGGVNNDAQNPTTERMRITATSVQMNIETLNVSNGGNSLEMATGSNNALIDFHSNSSFSTDYDSRILSTGGTAGTGGGSLAIFASTINMVTTNFNINSNLFRYVPPTSYTPTLITGTLPSKFGSYSITGSMMTVQIYCDDVGSTGTAGSGVYSYSIPSGYTINSVPFGVAPTNGAVIRYYSGYPTDLFGTVLGTGGIQARGSSTATVCVIAYNTTSLCLYASAQTTAQYNYQSSAFYQYSFPNLIISFSATFPIN